MSKNAESNQTPRSSSPKPPRSRALYLSGIACLLTLMGLLAAGYVLHTVLTLKKQVYALQKFTRDQAAQHHGLAQYVQQQFQKNQTAIAQLQQHTTDVKTEYAQVQANALVQLAKLNAHYANDLDGARTLLRLASQQLASLNTNDAALLQQQINHDLQQLNLTPRDSKTAHLTSLDSLIHTIKTLPIVHSVSVTPTPQHQTTPATHPWWDKVKENLAKLKSFINVTHVENPQSYAFTPTQTILVKQLILAKLIQAQWAVINNNPTLYQQSLNNTQLLLKELSLPEQTKLKINDRLDVLLKESPKPIFKLLQSSTSNKGEP